MNFDDFNPKMGWDSDEDDILNDFYKPALSRTKKYQRLAGYFSSTTFAIALRESLDFISNGGMMELVTSAELSEQDAKVIENSIEDREKILSDNLLEQIKNNKTDTFAKCASLMGWMLSNKIEGKSQLQIKIAIPQTPEEKNDPNSIYHQKVGIMTDAQQKKITFSGSVNETGKAWADNIEDFKVFKSWGDETNKQAVQIDCEKFNKFWENRANRTRVYDLPTAVKEHLIKIRVHSTFEFEEIISELKNSLGYVQKKKWIPWVCQQHAVEKIRESGYNGILKMATGTGKTSSALLMLQSYFNDNEKTGNRIMVLVPSGRDRIGGQWERFFLENKSKHDQVYLVSSDATAQETRDVAYVWKHGLGSKGNLFVIITIGSLDKFPFNENLPDFLIGDEVHEYGTQTRMNMIRKHLNNVKNRVGLSATPERFYDPDGTSRILDYFGPIRFTYCLKDAQKEEKIPGRETILSQYYYELHVTYLTDQEEKEVRELTEKIGQKVAIENDPTTSEGETGLSDQVKNLLIERARKMKTASNKLSELKRLLEINKKTLHNCLVYCEDIVQLEQVVIIFKQLNMDFVKYHYEILEREQSLELFKKHQRDFILSIKCLDQGLDIPDCQSLILLTGSTNPREYIQRRGRVLRNIPNKPVVKIFDIVTFPKQFNTGYEGMIKARLLQIWEFINASRSPEAKGKVIDIRNMYRITEEELTREIESWCK